MNIDTLNHLKDGDRALYDALAQSERPGRTGLERAAAVAIREHSRLDRTLLRLGLIDEADLLKAIENALTIPFFTDLSGLGIDEVYARQLGPAYLKQNDLVPIVTANGTTVFLTSDPLNSPLLDEIRFHLEEDIELASAQQHRVRTLLSEAFQAEPAGETAISDEQSERDRNTYQQAETSGPVIRFVSDTLSHAVGSNASDVHFESKENGLSIRFRINGVLVAQDVPGNLNASAIFARLKVMAKMNVAERRCPQDGRIRAAISGRTVDFRASSIPTQFGESFVCRILDPQALRLGWDQLGFDEPTREAIRRIVAQPNGMFLVTGPTGSGKTTTLYTALTELNEPWRKIISVEDPVEYQLSGIQQVQVHEEIDLTFAGALRSILRQDPNVIMIGEIRDTETAQIACRAALVGRMVLSTLHTNSAEGAFARLMDLGVEEYIVRDVLRGVLAQDLEILKCPSCSGPGCESCGFAGSTGRRLKTELREY